MVTEKVLCREKEYVRVFISDALQPLQFCGVKGDGMVELGALVESQAYTRNHGFEKCFE